MDPVLETYQEQLSLLPAINQEALSSIDWNSLIIEIGRKRGLHIDEIDDLRTETMLVLIGELDAQGYASGLMTRLGLPPSEIDKLVDEVNTGIFQPIHDYIVRGGPLVAAPLTPTQAPTPQAPSNPEVSTPEPQEQTPTAETMFGALQAANITPIDIPDSDPLVLSLDSTQPPAPVSDVPLTDAGITPIAQSEEPAAKTPTSDSMHTLADLLDQKSSVDKESDAIQKLEAMLAEKHASTESSAPAQIVNLDL